MGSKICETDGQKAGFNIMLREEICVTKRRIPNQSLLFRVICPSVISSPAHKRMGRGDVVAIGRRSCRWCGPSARWLGQDNRTHKMCRPLTKGRCNDGPNGGSNEVRQGRWSGSVGNNPAPCPKPRRMGHQSPGGGPEPSGGTTPYKKERGGIPPGGRRAECDGEKRGRKPIWVGGRVRSWTRATRTWGP